MKLVGYVLESVFEASVGHNILQHISASRHVVNFKTCQLPNLSFQLQTIVLNILVVSHFGKNVFLQAPRLMKFLRSVLQLLYY